MTQTISYAAMSKHDLIRVIETQQQTIIYEREKRQWYETVLSNKALPINQRLALIAVKRLEETRRPDDDGWTRAYLPALGEMVGVSPSSISRGLQNLHDCTQALERRSVPDAHEPYKSNVFIRSTDLLDRPADIAPTKEIKRHGGDHRIVCQSCGSDDIVEKKQHICRCCGTVVKAFDLREVNSPQEDETDPLQDATGENTHRAEFEDEQDDPLQDAIASFADAPEPLPAGVPENKEQVADPLQDAISSSSNTPPPLQDATGTSSYGVPAGFLETWLSNRRGHGQMIYSTGKLDQMMKYLHKPKDYTPDISAYLKGHIAHIYGSRPAYDDGTTYLLGFDCDTPEQGAQHLEWMTQLARAGIPSVYWKRRPGRGHLELYTDKAVDRKAFYAHVVSVCPGLAAIPECFPVGSDQNTGGVDRADFGYSWPCYYRVANQVMECAAEVLFACDQVPMKSTGIQSDRDRLTWLISQALTPAACIPTLPSSPQESLEGDHQLALLLRTCLPQHKAGQFTDGGLAKVVIADFNDAHTWEEITATIGGVKDNRFRAVWRNERTPSVVIDADGKLACDYGKHYPYPKKVDRFEAWCLINAIDKKEEVKRLIAEHEAQH
jgi:hypothetical protein